MWRGGGGKVEGRWRFDGEGMCWRNWCDVWILRCGGEVEV